MTINAVSASVPQQTSSHLLANTLKSARDIMRKDKGLNGDLDRLPMLTWLMFLKFLDDLESQREEEAALGGKKFRPALEAPYRWRDWAARADGITGAELLTFISSEECVRPDETRGPGLFAYLRELSSTNGDDRRDVIATVFRGVDNRMKSGYLLRDVINKVNSIHFASTAEIHTLGTLYESMLREMRDAAGDSGEFYTPRPVVRFMVDAINPRLGETILDPACGTGGFLVEAFEHLSRRVTTVEERKVLQQNSLFGFEPKPLPYLLAQMNLLLHGLDAPEIDPGNALRFKLTEIGDNDRFDVILTNPPFGGEEERGIQDNFPDDLRTSETALLFLQLIMRRLRRATSRTGNGGRAAVVVPESVMGDAGVAQRVRKQLIEDFNLHTIVRLPKGVFEPYSDIQTNLLFFDREDSTNGLWFYQHEVPKSRRGMRTPCYTRTFPIQFEEFGPLLQWWSARESNDFAWQVTKADLVRRDYSLDFRNPKTSGPAITGPASIAQSVAEPLAQLSAPLDKMIRKTESLQKTGRPERQLLALGSFLTRDKTEEEVKENQGYRQITVRLYGKGVVLRQSIRGGEIRTRPQFRASAGQLIVSRIDARNGAFGIVPSELDGALVTQDFPLFAVNHDKVLADFLALMLQSTRFVDACKRASRGTTNRKRLREELFLAEVIPIPSLEFQSEVVSVARLLEECRGSLTASYLAAQSALPALADWLVEA